MDALKALVQEEDTRMNELRNDPKIQSFRVLRDKAEECEQEFRIRYQGALNGKLFDEDEENQDLTAEDQEWLLEHIVIPKRMCVTNFTLVSIIRRNPATNLFFVLQNMDFVNVNADSIDYVGYAFDAGWISADQWMVMCKTRHPLLQKLMLKVKNSIDRVFLGNYIEDMLAFVPHTEVAQILRQVYFSRDAFPSDRTYEQSINNILKARVTYEPDIYRTILFHWIHEASPETLAFVGHHSKQQEPAQLLSLILLLSDSLLKIKE